MGIHTNKYADHLAVVLPKRSSQQAETPRNSNFFMDRLVSLESPRSPASPRYVNAAYFPQYIARHERYPSTFDLTKLSHVFYAYASIDEEGGLIFSDEVVDFSLQVDGTNGYLKAWTQLKSQHSLKIILSVGGEGASCKKFAWVGAEAYRRERFSTSAKHLLQLYDLDGIDLNWGDPASSEDGQHLLELVKTVRKSFKTKYMITACVPAIENILERLPLSALAIQLDLVNLMAYNFVDSRSTDTGHHAQLSTRQKARSNAGEQSCEIVVGYLKR
jgi:chitinase